MSNLVFRNKYPAFTLVLILLISLTFSCRKKIDHIPSSSDPVVRWRMVTNVGNTISSIEVFNNELYVAGRTYGSNNYYIPTLQKVNANFELENFHNGIFSKIYDGGSSYTDPEIYKLYVYSDRLYIGGNFKFNINNATSLMYYDLNGNFTPIPMLSKNPYYISSFCGFQNNLIVGGYFGSDDPLVSTNYTERIQNDVAIGLGNFPAKVIALSLHSNQLYGIGENKTIRKWNGSIWGAVTYNNQGSSDHLYDICSYNNELYLLGSFEDYVALKKLNASGNWEDVPEINDISSGKLKVIDDKLYLFGNYINLNGEHSSVVVYDGSNWKSVGKIQSGDISNLVKFNGKLVCSINSLLYVYE